MSGEDRTSDAIVSLKKIFENPISRYLLKYFTKKDRLDKALKIYCGIEKPKNISERINAWIVASAVDKGASVFGGKREDFINYFKDIVPRRGLSLVLRSVAEYGITKPQKLVAPFLVVWDSTSMCNLKCKHCYANAGKLAPGELTTEERKKLIDDIYDAGVIALAISGGEPTIRKDFLEIVKYAHDKGLYVSVASNGTLITKKFAKKLKKTGVDYIEISLDHTDPKVHDKFRGVDGAWKKTVEGIKNCVDAGIVTCIATTVTKYNYDDVPKMVELAEKLKVDRFIAFNFIPTRRGKEIVDMDITPEQREKLLNFLYDKLEEDNGLEVFSTCPAYARISLEKVKEGEGKSVSPTHFADVPLSGRAIALADFIGGCGAGRNYCSVEYNGDMQPCVFIPIKVGNAMKDGFENVWKNSKVLKKLRDRELLKNGCGKCEYKYVCGGCRARAYAYYGDILASDPGCVLVEKNKNK